MSSNLLRAFLLDQAREAHEVAGHTLGRRAAWHEGAAHMADAVLTWLAEHEPKDAECPDPGQAMSKEKG